jgi:hypothetical protein
MNIKPLNLLLPSIALLMLIGYFLLPQFKAVRLMFLDSTQFVDEANRSNEKLDAELRPYIERNKKLNESKLESDSKAD